MKEPKLLNVNPVVGYVDSFVEKDVFETLRSDLKTLKLKQSKVFAGSNSSLSKQRTSQNYRVGREEFDSVKEVTAMVGVFFGLKRLCCTNRLKDVLPLSPGALSKRTP